MIHAENKVLNSAGCSNDHKSNHINIKIEPKSDEDCGVIERFLYNLNSVSKVFGCCGEEFKLHIATDHSLFCLRNLIVPQSQYYLSRVLVCGVISTRLLYLARNQLRLFKLFVYLVVGVVDLLIGYVHEHSICS